MCYSKIALFIVWSFKYDFLLFYCHAFIIIFAFKAQKQLCSDVQQNKSS